MREADRLEARDRLLVVRGRRGGMTCGPGHLAGTLVELGSPERIGGEIDRLLEVVQRLLARGERGRAFPCAGEQLPRLVPDAARVLRVRDGVERGQVVRRQDLDELVLV